MMQKYIIFSGFATIITNSCNYAGFIGNRPLFSWKSWKFLYICRISLKTGFNPEKWCTFAGFSYFCRI